MKPHLPLFIRGGKKTTENKNGLPKVDLHRAGLAIVTVVILSLLLSMHMPPGRVSLKLGDVSPEDIYAHATVRYKDTAATELRRSQAAASVGRVYDVVPSAADQSVGALKEIFRAIEAVRRDSEISTDSEVVWVRHRLGGVLGEKVTDAALITLLTVDSDTLRNIEDTSLRIVSAKMSGEIREEAVSMQAARKSVAAEAQDLLADTAVATAVGEVAQDALRPNRTYDYERTKNEQDQAQKSISPEYGLIESGEKIIGKGETVLQEHIDKFDALGLRYPRVDYRSIASFTLFTIVALLLVAAYLLRYHEDVYTNNKTLTLLAIIVVASIFALRVGGSILGVTLSPEQVGYIGIMWVVTAGMLISVLLNPQVAVVITGVLSIVVSMLVNNELRYAASALITSLVGIYSVANIRERMDLIRSGGALAGVGVLLVWIMGGIADDSLVQMLIGSVWAIVLAVVSPWLFIVGTMLLERPFGRTTHLSMLELADTNKPLLRTLLMEAPGTYTHSMAVGHLAELAAEAIGADSLVTRVASYYHDIGKIKRPHFFIENQHVENVHDRMNPTLSALVITSHIKDGEDIARESKLPKIVQDVIVQHHGTSLVQYFYSQAADEQDPSTALEQQFRYNGPRPQTKEAAIVMLADSVEAASRCISKPTHSKIELMVNRVLAEKLRDNQLDESELTFQDLSKIASGFVRTLTSTMHARIEYPDVPGAEGRKLSANGNSDSEQPKDNGESPEAGDGDTTVAAGGSVQ